MERGEIKRLLVNMPPRHGKSATTTELFPAWFLGRNPDLRVVVACHTSDLALDFSRHCRAFVREHGPDTFGIDLARDSTSVQSWDIAGHAGGLKALGVGGPLTGRGADLLIIDDPIKDFEAAESPTARRAIWNWYQTVARTRLAPGGRVIIIQTRWHQDDLTGRVLKLQSEKGGIAWHELVMPIVDEAAIKAGTPKAEAQLWPGRFDESELADLEIAAGPYGWEALYMQRPSNPEGTIFKRDWFRFYTTHPERVAEGVEYLDPSTLEIKVQSWDCAFKDTDGSDYVCGGVWGTRGAKRYLLDLTWDKLDFLATVNAVRTMSAAYPDAIGKLIEDKANGPAVITSLESEVGGVLPVEPCGSKVARARAVQPLVAAGNVYLPIDAQWTHPFLNELVDFPSAPNDDRVDMTTQALLHLNLENSALLRARAMVTD